MKIDQKAINDINIALKAEDKFILSRIIDAHPEFASADYQDAIAPYFQKAMKVNPEFGKMFVEAGVDAKLAGPENAAALTKMFGGKFPTQTSLHKDAAAKIEDINMAIRKGDEIIMSRMIDSAPYLANPEFADRMDKSLVASLKIGNKEIAGEFEKLGISGRTLSPEDIHSMKGNKLAMDFFGKQLKDAKTPQEIEIRKLQVALIDPATSDATLAAINAPVPEPEPVVQAPAPVAPVSTNPADIVAAEVIAGKPVSPVHQPSAANIKHRVKHAHHTTHHHHKPAAPKPE